MRKRLLEMLSRWPRYLSQGPAAEIWSVVHLPLILIRITMSSRSLPRQGLNGASSCRRSDVGEFFHLLNGLHMRTLVAMVRKCKIS